MKTLPKLEAELKTTCGFMTVAQLADLATLDRLRQVLVRCGRCRFQCAAQDAEFLKQAISQAGDYVRDVSLPASDKLFKAELPPLPIEEKPLPSILATQKPVLAASKSLADKINPNFFNEVKAGKKASVFLPVFDEADCGGVLGADGQVYSDADSGL